MPSHVQHLSDRPSSRSRPLIKPHFGQRLSLSGVRPSPVVPVPERADALRRKRGQPLVSRRTHDVDKPRDERDAGAVAAATPVASALRASLEDADDEARVPSLGGAAASTSTTLCTTMASALRLEVRRACTC